MGKKLPDAPLVYMHEHFKKLNKSSLKNNWVWYSTEDLQNVLDAINQIKGDGARIYYGIYNKRVCDYLDQLLNASGTGRSYKDHEGHNTAFFVPTYKGNTEDEHVDNITATSVSKIKKDYEADLPITHNEKLVNQSTAFDTGGHDVGDICPPPTPPNTTCPGSGSNL